VLFQISQLFESILEKFSLLSNNSSSTHKMCTRVVTLALSSCVRMRKCKMGEHPPLSLILTSVHATMVPTHGTSRGGGHTVTGG
jgi:hypothetical protein